MKARVQPKVRHIRRGDIVKVLSGADAGKTGKVLQVFPKKGTAIVEGVRLVTKHLRKSPDYPKGAIIKVEAPIPVCKLKRVTPAREGASS